MVMLVHIAPAKLAARIRRSGLRPGKGLFGDYKTDAVYAFPVLKSYMLTHQWTREIMKWRRQAMIGVYFRIADDETVEFGRYNKPLRRVQAAAAAGEIAGLEDPRGYEIILYRAVGPKEIVRITKVRGVVGWRHMPDAHLGPLCGCPACVARGEPGGRKLRERYRRGEL